jgi:hypothetical protein
VGKHLALLIDMVFGFKSFSEAPHLARKCGTHRTDSPVRALLSTTAKPGQLYPLVWIPCCDTVSEKPGSQSRVGRIAGNLESWVMCYDRQD